MDFDRDSKRVPYHGWKIRSYLTNASFDGIVAAGARAMLWIDNCKSNPRRDDVEPSRLSTGGLLPRLTRKEVMHDTNTRTTYQHENCADCSAL